MNTYVLLRRDGRESRLPADEIIPVADTVLVRPDPVGTDDQPVGAAT